jgi:hypothetical protein
MRSKYIVDLFLIFCVFFSQKIFSADWERVYLASYPNSGNHWVRYLVEDAAHIASSSVYQDPEPYHLPDAFPWGGFCSPYGYRGNCRYPEISEKVLLKTHYPRFSNKAKNFDLKPYKKTIRIVRHPVDTIYACYKFWVRDQKNPPARIPRRQLRNHVKWWKGFHKYWNKQPNVITIRYEDIFNDAEIELRKMLEILEYKVSDDDIIRALVANPPTGSILKHYRYFYPEDIEYIKKELKDLIDQFGYKFP